MKITYTSPNSSHHYQYAKGFDDLDVLNVFISGWPRFAPSARRFKLNNRIIRADLFQALALIFGRYCSSRDIFYKLSNSALDAASYKYAKQSDFFIYYRTTGVATNRRLKEAQYPTVCIVEEVNSHVLHAHQLILDEYLKLGLGPCAQLHSYDLRKRLDAYQIADYILCPSSFVRRSLIHYGISSDRIIINPFGMKPLAPLPPDQKKPDKDVFRILYVGQINIRKGLRYLVEAFRLLNHPCKELVIVGPQTSVTGLEQSVIPDNVTFTGTLKGQALSEQYYSASVFVLPSVEEGMALVLGEALASGLPIIATTNTGAEDIITDGVEGFIVEPCNSRQLVDALQKLIDDKDLRDDMSFYSVKTAATVFSWQASVDSLVQKLSTLHGHHCSV
jgi:starch synthase